MLEAAEDPEPASTELEDKIAEAEHAPKRSLDDLLAREPTKPDWPT
jgi:hypothetical protein